MPALRAHGALDRWLRCWLAHAQEHAPNTRQAGVVGAVVNACTEDDWRYGQTDAVDASTPITGRRSCRWWHLLAGTWPRWKAMSSRRHGSGRRIKHDSHQPRWQHGSRSSRRRRPWLPHSVHLQVVCMACHASGNTTPTQARHPHSLRIGCRMRAWQTCRRWPWSGWATRRTIKEEALRPIPPTQLPCFS